MHHSSLRITAPENATEDSCPSLVPTKLGTLRAGHMFTEFLEESMVTGPGGGPLQLGWPRSVNFTGGTDNCHTKQKILPAPCLMAAPGKTPNSRTEY